MVYILVATRFLGGMQNTHLKMKLTDSVIMYLVHWICIHRHSTHTHTHSLLHNDVWSPRGISNDVDATCSVFCHCQNCWHQLPSHQSETTRFLLPMIQFPKPSRFKGTVSNKTALTPDAGHTRGSPGHLYF